MRRRNTRTGKRERADGTFARLLPSGTAMAKGHGAGTRTTLSGQGPGAVAALTATPHGRELLSRVGPDTRELRVWGHRLEPVGPGTDRVTVVIRLTAQRAVRNYAAWHGLRCQRVGEVDEGWVWWRAGECPDKPTWVAYALYGTIPANLPLEKWAYRVYTVHGRVLHGSGAGGTPLRGHSKPRKDKRPIQPCHPVPRDSTESVIRSIVQAGFLVS